MIAARYVLSNTIFIYLETFPIILIALIYNYNYTFVKPTNELS